MPTCGKTASGRDGRMESPTYEMPYQSLIELIRLLFRSIKCHVHSCSGSYVAVTYRIYTAILFNHVRCRDNLLT
jgi:hypothetical protein